MLFYSIILFILSMLLLCMGLLYPDLLVFAIGLALFFLSVYPSNKVSRYFGWIAALILCLTVLFIPSPKPTFYSPTPSIEPITHTETQTIVYTTPHGQRYHIKSTCGGKNSKQTSLDQAINQGYTPCKKCVD